MSFRETYGLLPQAEPHEFCKVAGREVLNSWGVHMIGSAHTTLGSATVNCTPSGCDREWSSACTA
jgi:hypothetical protein